MALTTRYPVLGREITPLQVLAGLGAIGVAKTLLRIAQAIHLNLHRGSLRRYHHPPSTPTNDRAKDHPWALVTGASSGIGLEIATQLAARGFNVILHGRNEAKLQGIVSDLQQKYPNTSFKLLILDAGLNEIPNFDSTVLSCTEGLNLTVVIHNVGGGGNHDIADMRTFTEYDADTVDKWFNINARFATQLTRVLLPKLAKSQPSLLVFISSCASLMQAPYVTVYVGANAYLNIFADCLRMEMKLAKLDIEVKSLLPGTVATATSGRTDADRSLTMPLTGEWVRSMFHKVGYESAVIIPWYGHQFQIWFLGILPQRLADYLVLRMCEAAKAQMDAAAAKEK